MSADKIKVTLENLTEIQKPLDDQKHSHVGKVNNRKIRSNCHTHHHSTEIISAKYMKKRELVKITGKLKTESLTLLNVRAMKEVRKLFFSK